MNNDIVSAILRDDIEFVGQALQRPDTNELFYGFEDLGRWSVANYENAGRRDVYAEHCYALLEQLARALAVVRVPNPEAPDLRFDVPPPSELAARVERALGFPIRPPELYPNYYGLNTSLGIIGQRVLHALYGVHRVKQLTADTTKPRVLEIGAGLGRLAHYAHLAGITDYWIVDVPLTSLAHGHFLASTLGREKVVLDREPEPPAGSGHIRILSADRFFKSPLPRFDLVVNIDSLTELGRPLAERYVRRVAPLSRMLFSINHEANEFTVAEVTREARAFKHSQRYPCWIREGYVEEVFRHEPHA